jgi:hypothetical protein
VAGYRARAAWIGLAVDNFFTEKIFNDFKAQMVKSLEMRLFVIFCGYLIRAVDNQSRLHIKPYKR